jgi:hypothetical protein
MVLLARRIFSAADARVVRAVPIGDGEVIGVRACAIWG